MKLSREIFWDVNYDSIDWDKSRDWVICRVLEYGSMEDWRAIRKYYGDNTIVEAAVTARSLSKKTMHFIHHIFNIPFEKFRCYNLALSNPLHWMY